MDLAMNSLNLLNEIIGDLPEAMKRSALHVTSHPLFLTAPGASTHHHNYKGGLVRHTYEVVSNCLQLSNPKFLRVNELVLAAVWHDFHKIYEYEFLEGKVISTPYKRTIGHVVGSVIEFQKVSITSANLDEEMVHRISHMMLAHHGRVEWNSPVAPRSAEAYILHIADMISAQRLDL